jgi:hypothetical protein
MKAVSHEGLVFKMKQRRATTTGQSCKSTTNDRDQNLGKLEQVNCVIGKCYIGFILSVTGLYEIYTVPVICTSVDCSLLNLPISLLPPI